MYIGIVQNVSGIKITQTYTGPKITQWILPLPIGTRVDVPVFIHTKLELDNLYLDADENNAPLYSMEAEGFKRPVPCSGGEEAKATDAPYSDRNYPPGQGPGGTAFDGEGRIVAFYMLPVLKGIRIEATFTTWCVTFDDSDIDNVEVYPLREKKWSLDVDSTKSDQHATVAGGDTAPTTEPHLEAPFANDALRTAQVSIIEQAEPKTPFYYP